MFKRLFVVGVAMAMLITQTPVSVYASNGAETMEVPAEFEDGEEDGEEEFEDGEEDGEEDPEDEEEQDEKEDSITRKVAWTAPEANYVDCSIVLSGYSSSADFYNEGYEYRMYFSRTGDFEQSETATLVSTNHKEVTGNVEVTLLFSYWGEENTTYYVKAVQYDTTLQEETIIDTFVVTTAEAMEFDVSMEVEKVYVSKVVLNLSFEGMEYDFINNYIYLEMTEDAEFENTTRYGLGLSSSTSTTHELSKTIEKLSSATTYYARLVALTGSNGEAVAISPVVEFVTNENVIYTQEDIPDEALRNIIMEKVSSFDTEGFEALTELTLERKSGETAITDLTGIELLTNLTCLKICYHEISDIFPITKLAQLETLEIENCKVNMIPNLSALSMLENLSLKGNIIPVGEFTANNGNIPAKFRTDEQWLTQNKEAQRTSEEIDFVIADCYYPYGTEGYALQVEINNIYAVNVYTLSVYEGEKLLAEGVSAMSIDSGLRIADWLLDDVITSAGLKTLTFVVSTGGEEVGRCTKTVEFKESNILGESRYISSKATAVSTYFYVYNTTQEVESVTVKDALGKIQLQLEVSSTDTGNWDYRYEDIFQNTLIRTDYRYISVSGEVAKYLSVGSYDLEVTFTDGNVVIWEKALEAVDAPVLENLSGAGAYPGGMEENAVYITVTAMDLDWDKAYPVVCDSEGYALTEFSEYKIIDEKSAIYKLTKKENADWAQEMLIRLENNTGGMILNGEKQGSVTMRTYANVYHAEFDWLNQTMLVLTENMEEDVVYLWKLTENADGSGEVFAQATAAVGDDRAVLEFKAEDGSAYDFTKESRSYYLSTWREESCVTSGKTVTISYYGGGVSASVEYPISLEGYKTYYINDKSTFSGGFSVAASVLSKDSVMTVSLCDANGTRVADGTIGLTGYEEYWYVSYRFENLKLTNDMVYYLEIIADDVSLGKVSVCVLDEEKSYYETYSYDWNWSTKRVYMNLRGIWSENLEGEKAELNFFDAAGEKVASGKVAEYEITDNQVTFYFDLSSDWENLTTNYPVLYWEITCEGDRVSYIYGNEFCDNSIRMSEQKEKEISLFYCSSLVGDVSVLKCAGVTGNAYNQNLKVYIYLPYGTTAVKSFEINTTESGSCWFTSVNLAGLKYTDELKCYDVLVVDEEGNYVDFLTNTYLYALQVNPFSDVSRTAWYYSYVEYAYSYGFMNGTGTDDNGLIIFKPEESIPREQFVQVLFGKEGLNAAEIEYTERFVDVEEDKWYTAAVLWAEKNGIVSGISEDSFGVGDLITREQIATMLYSYAKYKGYDVSGRADITEFKDEQKISGWAKEAMEWAVDSGIMSGSIDSEGNKILNPSDYASRAECATMVKSFIVAYESEWTE